MTKKEEMVAIEEDFDNPAILSEDETKTKPNVNYYRLNDGTAEIIISSKHVNYFDENEYQMVCGYRRTLRVEESWKGKTMLFT